MNTVAIILFILTYALLLTFPTKRAHVAITSAILFVILGILPIGEVLTAVNWNVIFMIVGTMGVVNLFIESKMPSLLADVIIEKTPNVKWTIISLSLFAGIISAFVDNVATVLMVAPVAITIAKKLKISPVNSVIAISIASNLQGAATLVGDTTSILLGGALGMNFLDFFFFEGKPGLFWIVQIGAVASTFVLLYIFRKDKQSVESLGRTKVKDYFPTVLLVGIIVLLIIASFLPNMPENINGIICMAMFAIGLIRKVIVTKDLAALNVAAEEIDYTTILLLTGLFVIIGGLVNVGVVDDIGNLFTKISDNPFVIYTIIVWASVLCSAFIDNIPYVATMLPVVGAITTNLGMDGSYLLYFGLLIGATLGGNLTPIGASANITGLGILRKEGYEVKASEFMKISVPFTLVAVMAGYVMIWFLWK
ncbi:MAG: TRAP transporter large permease subunit [Clostridiales bacterium]|nr:TRAP transporter large permease subunit [Clostridiales bacterium]